MKPETGRQNKLAGWAGSLTAGAISLGLGLLLLVFYWLTPIEYHDAVRLGGIGGVGAGLGLILRGLLTRRSQKKNVNR